MTLLQANSSRFGFSHEGEPMLAHHRYQAARNRVIDAADNAYERLSKTNDYQRNENRLKVIQVCVVTLSAVSTGFVNSLAHVERLGWPLAVVLALLVTAFVEGFFFSLRHGLTTTYKSGAQRLYAAFWYTVLKATMVLNVAILGLWIFDYPAPPWLLTYNHYSLGIHFAAALFGVSMVRDADPVVRNRILELRAETARQDLITARKVTAIGSPLVLIFAKLRGILDSLSIAFRVLFRGGGFAKSYVEQVETIARTQFSHLDNITTPHGRPYPAPVSTFPKGPAQRP